MAAKGSGASKSRSKSKKGEADEVAVSLAGATAVDEALIDEAVARINHIAVTKGLEAARALGEYVLQTFFANDLDRFRDGAGSHVTWRALADHEGLRVSHSTLWSSVAILDQLRMLPENIASALPVSHHRRLLVVKDPVTKLSIATDAAEHGFTVKELEEKVAAVRAAQRSGAKRGRKPTPPVQRFLRDLASAVHQVNKDTSTETLDALSEGEVGALLEELDQQLATLAGLRADLARRSGQSA